MSFVIECDTCIRQHSESCSDCMVTFLMEGQPSQTGVVIDIASFAAVKRLQSAGLVPGLQHRTSTG